MDRYTPVSKYPSAGGERREHIERLAADLFTFIGNGGPKSGGFPQKSRSGQVRFKQFWQFGSLGPQSEGRRVATRRFKPNLTGLSALLFCRESPTGVTVVVSKSQATVVVKRQTQAPLLSFRRGLIGAISGACAAALGFVVARPLVALFHKTAPWVLPVAMVGTLALVVVCVLALLPLMSRRAHKWES
jgi:hypothetical protein